MTPLARLKPIAFLMTLSLSIPAFGGLPFQADDQAAIRTLVERYFAAYAREDIDAITAMWSDKSPELASAKTRLKELFSANDAIEIRNLRFRRSAVEGNRATALVSVEIAAVDANTKKPQVDLGKRSQNIELVKEAGEWKIQRDASAEAELAERLIAAKSDEERSTLVGEDSELLTVELRKALLQPMAALMRKGSYAQALAIFELTGKIAEQIHDTAGVAQAAIGIGYVRRLQGNLNQSLDSYKKALGLCEPLDRKECVATSLTGIGIVHHLRREFSLAEENYRKALDISEASGNKKSTASALNALGLIQKDTGKYAEALEQFQRSISIFEALADKLGMGDALTNTGLVHSLRGDLDSALSSYLKGLAQFEQSGNKLAVATALEYAGTAHNQRGNLGAAMSFLQLALATYEELDNKPGITHTLGKIGTVHFQQGNLGLALEYQQKSLAMSEAVNDKAAMIAGLNNLGLVYSAMGDYEQALAAYQKSVSVSESSRNRRAADSALTNIGEVYRQKGEYDLALNNYTKSLRLKEELGDRWGMAPLRANMGLAYYQKGDYSRALELTEQAVSLSRETSNREVLWRALTTAGRAYHALGQPIKASESYQGAITTIEGLREDIGGGEQERQQSFEKKVGPYYRMIELLAEQNNASEALSYAERAKARVLLDVMGSGKIDISKTMTTEEKAREQNIRALLVSLNTQISRESLRSQPDEKQLAELRTRLEKARLEYRDFQTRLYAAHPDLKVHRGNVSSMTLQEMNALLTEPKTALLEFAVAEEKTFLFVLTSNAGTRNGLQQPVLKLFDLPIKRRDLVDKVQQLNQRIANNDLEYTGLSRELYDLLVAPARQQLQGKTRLVIVPDNILWETPFQALRSADGRFFIQSAAISYAPSLTVLREIVKSRKSHSDNTLLAMGNPKLAGQTISRSKSVLMSASFEPLPDAERLVRGLAQMYGAKTSKVYVGADAREDLLKAEASSYRVLQLATHGVINNVSPMYSHIVLAQSEDGKEDGLLEAWEIMQMDLKAELAVLSACETARGRFAAGEGVVGLSWALFVAGCPTTVVSQWKVESSSTIELMLAFHRNLKAGTSKSEALRQAAIKLMADKRYNHPFYWAGFIVVGDP